MKNVPGEPRVFADVTRKKPAILRLDEKGGPASSLSLPETKNFLLVEKKSRRVPKTRELTLLVSTAILLVSFLNLLNIFSRGLELKDQVADAASNGYRNLVQAGLRFSDAEFSTSGKFFEEAKRAFDNAEKQLWFVQNNQNGTAQSAVSLISAGRSLSEAGTLFTNVASSWKNLPELFFDENTKRLSLGQTHPSLTEKIKSELPNLTKAFELLQKSNGEIKRISSLLVPKDLREPFSFAKISLQKLTDSVNALRVHFPAILSLLGDREPHQFLILLQNNAEIRPTGGFIGSFVLLEMNDGYLTKSAVHDVYQSDYQLKENIPPPEEIRSINKRWFLRDSNYSPHFPLSAEKAAWFLNKENGPTVDTVIALDQTVLAELFDITGPISLPEFNTPLTKENFNTILSYIIESKLPEFGGTMDPKQILKAFVPRFQEELLRKTDFAKLSRIIEEAIREKHLMAYSRDPEVQQFFEDVGMAGKMTPPKDFEDYLNVIHISVGGNKSDAYIEESIRHDTFLRPDGTFENEVSITRKHLWTSAEEKRSQSLLRSFGFSNFPDAIKDVLGRGKNVVFTKVYVPLGSRLIDANEETQTKEDPETGRTYFFTKLVVSPGDETTYVVRYEVPFRLSLDPAGIYRLSIQKQMGRGTIDFTKRIFPEGHVRSFRSFPEKGYFDSDGVWNYTTELRNDISLASLWGK